MVFCKRSPSEAKLGNHKMGKFKDIMFTKQRRWLYLFWGVFSVKIRLRVRVLFLILKDSLGIDALLPSSLTVWGLTSNLASPNLQVFMGNKINASAGLMERLWGSVILHSAWFVEVLVVMSENFTRDHCAQLTLFSLPRCVSPKN